MQQQQCSQRPKLDEHPCLIYETQDELSAVFVSYLRAGLILGERCIYFIDENSEEFVVNAMGRNGFDIQSYVDSKALLVIKTNDTHLKHGHFNEQIMLDYWAAALADAGRDGFTGLRAAVEMTWAAAGGPGSDQLVAYESRLNRFTSAHNISVVCQYRRSKFLPAVLKGVIHAHPVIMANHQVFENAGYVSPDVFVAGDEAMEVQGLLDNIALIDRLQRQSIELMHARDAAVKANELKTQFVANISHEIRTPLNGLISALDLLNGSEDFDHTTTELIEVSQASARSLLGLMNNLLDFSKLEAGKAETRESRFTLGSVLREVLSLSAITAESKGLQLNVEVENSLLTKPLVGDASLITQVLLNLIHNAIKFTDSGTVRIQAETRDEDSNGTTLRCTITDTGIGIGPDDQKMIFQPFAQADGSSTRKHGGTGLGLSICQAYIKLMGGTMGLFSKLNEGSSFWFDVPMKLAV